MPTAEPTGAERRAHPRRPTSAEIELVSETVTQRGSLLDVSPRGACVRTARTAGEWGDRVELRRPGDPGAGIAFHIVRVKPDERGIELGLRVDPECCHELEALLASL